MYTEFNYKTKKAMKEALAQALANGRRGLPCFQPGPFGPGVRDGSACCEGPHYPEPHKWYASCTVQNIDGQPYIVKAR